jgi:uncharacterized membrane protein
MNDPKRKKGRTLLYILCVIFSLLLVHYALGSERAVEVARTLRDRGIGPLMATGIISMVPIFELRGGIPIGIALFKENPFLVYLISVVCNIIPVLPILLFLNPLRKLLENLPLFRGLFRFLTLRAEKNRALIERYEEFGLMLFVAVPLPVTGAWTGSLVAVLMGLKILKSFLFISAGVLVAGLIVTILTVLGRLGIILAAALLLIFAAVYVINILISNAKGEKNPSHDS